jgi:hypothetical protein
MNTTRRYISLDILRGVGILSIVFLHSCFAHYKNITKINFDDPPLIVTIIGFLLMWSGLFALISAIAHTSTQLSRLKNGFLSKRSLFYYFFSAGFFIIILHYFYFLLLGPVVLDFENNNHNYSLLSGFLHNGFFDFNLADRFFYNSSLSMIGWDLVIIGVILYLLIKIFGENLSKMAKAIGLIGTFVILLSIVRIPLFTLVDQVRQNHGLLYSVSFDLLINKNDPLLPYMGFGLFGAMIGLLVSYETRVRKIFKYLGTIASAWIIAGLVSYRFFPDTMLERSIDGLWFSIMLIQLGLFIWFVLGMMYFFDYRNEEKKDKYAKKLHWLRQFGLVSLTIFMLETPLSEITARMWSGILPGWDLNINKVMLFGLFNVFVWLLIIRFWRKNNFRYSFEWLTVKVFKKIGRRSNKMDAIENLEKLRENAN